MNLLTEGTFKLFQSYISDKCGIYIGPDKKYLIETRLDGLRKEMGAATFYDLYWLIKDERNAANPLIIEKIVNSITTNETSWFRDLKPWNVLTNMLLPRYTEELKNETRKEVKIWSAAASTGQEAYSTAIAITSYLSQNELESYQRCFNILATDISGEVLKFAEEGIYDSISVTRGLDNHYLEKYFLQSDKLWQISPAIKEMVRFRQFNLQDSFLLLGSFDVIFLRNVLIYFSDDLKKDIFKKTRDALLRDGILFIGSSEYYSGMNQYFETAKENGDIYYRRLPTC